MKKQDNNATAAAMAQQTPNAQTADQEAKKFAFARLLRAYEHATATGADTAAPLYALATACALSVLTKCIDPQRKTAEKKETISNNGISPALTAVRRGIKADIALLEKLTAAHNAAYALQYNAEGDLVQIVVDKAAEKAAAALQSETLSDGLDLVNAAVVAILEQTADHAAEVDRADLCERVTAAINAELERTHRPELSALANTVLHGIESGWTLDQVNAELTRHNVRPLCAWMETPYTVRRLSRRVLIRADDAAKWDDETTSPIREVYRAIRREVQNSRAMQTDPRNGYSYIEDTAADPDSTATETIYRRLHKWADLGGYTNTGHYDAHGNASRGGLYTADAQTAADYAAVLAALNLTDRQATIVRLRMSGYGYKAIAKYLGVNQAAVNIQLYRLREKCEKLGFSPAMWAEMTAEN